MGDLLGVNASPLIVLARAGHLRLLQIAATRIVVPRAVTNEINRRGPDDPAVKAMQSAGWLEVIDAPPIPPIVAARDLGSGESALISWGLSNPTAELVLDDLAARRCALGLGLRVRGTLSLLTEAKRNGVIPLVAPVIADIRRAGLYVSDRLAQQVSASAGE